MPSTTERNGLPRVLCLHGGGTSSNIFRRQCRTLIRLFAPYFRLVFANGPYPSEVAGPDVLAVYSSCGPFRRWLRSLPEHARVDNQQGADAIEASMRQAMAEDDATGARGEWVGLMGFSQGVKVAASVLLETQARADQTRVPTWCGTTAAHKPRHAAPKGFAGVEWRFGIFLASRPPLISLSDITGGVLGLDSPSELPNSPHVVQGSLQSEYRLRIPSVHVHGTRDSGLELHQTLLTGFTAAGSAELVEWDGDHRVPIKSHDAQRIVQATLRSAQASHTCHITGLIYSNSFS